MIEKGDGSIGKLLAQGQCPRCHTVMKPVEVHGHTQCPACKMVVGECCTGETADDWPVDRADD